MKLSVFSTTSILAVASLASAQDTITATSIPAEKYSGVLSALSTYYTGNSGFTALASQVSATGGFFQTDFPTIATDSAAVASYNSEFATFASLVNEAITINPSATEYALVDKTYLSNYQSWATGVAKVVNGETSKAPNTRGLGLTAVAVVAAGVGIALL